MITLQYIKECFTYNIDSGLLIWNIRPLSHFKNEAGMNIFNSTYSGNNAGSLSVVKNNNYLRIKLLNKSLMAHRVIWFYVHGVWPECIDHIDGNGLNNKLSNIRSVNASQNNRNRRTPSNNKTGVIGVRQLKQGVWESLIMVNKKAKRLGRFTNFNDAVIARKMAEYKYSYHQNHGRQGI